MLLRVCPRRGLCWRETACSAGRKGAGTVLWPPSRASTTWVLKSQYLSGHHIFPFLIAYYATSHSTSLNFNYNSERMFCFFNRGLWAHSQRHRWGGFTKVKSFLSPSTYCFELPSAAPACLPAVHSLTKCSLRAPPPAPARRVNTPPLPLLLPPPSPLTTKILHSPRRQTVSIVSLHLLQTMSN